MHEIAKVLFVGDGGVGKTSLIRRFLRDMLADKMTVGVDFTILKVGDDKVAFVWDIGGEERFEFFTESLMKGAKLVILVYDVSIPKTLFNLKKWAEKVHEANSTRIPAIVVGNKIDLGKNIGDDVVNEIIKELPLNVLEYIETSAVTGENIDKLFNAIKKYLAIL